MKELERRQPRPSDCEICHRRMTDDSGICPSCAEDELMREREEPERADEIFSFRCVECNRLVEIALHDGAKPPDLNICVSCIQDDATRGEFFSD